MKKSTKLRNLLMSKETEFIMEAHNGLSAKIVEEVGFKGVWGSGLSISAALGVRDNNEASWTQVLEVCEFMSDATDIPILLDGDTGYGNFNNLRRLIRKLESRQIAGVCIEDKLFPKTNSFIGGETQPLADMDEFCGKIKSAKDSQTDPDFVVVARIEAFIAGWGLGEALKRAEAYRQAGADAILVHSKRPTAADIEAFMAEWGNRHPVVVVPTKYFSTPTERFRELGINLVIWANHNLRATITAVRNNAQRIFSDQSLINVESKIASVSEIFRLQGADELKEAEKRYLPTAGKKVNAVVLAAAQGKLLGELTQDRPKALLKINGESILNTQIKEFNRSGVKDITVVRGFAKETIANPGLHYVDNDEYETTTELMSLYMARDHIKADTIISYGDIIFKYYILFNLLQSEDDITIVVDADAEQDDSYHDYVVADHSYSKRLFDTPVSLEGMYPVLEKEKINGDFIGLLKVNGKGAEVIKTAMETLSKRDDFVKLRMCDLLNECCKHTRVSIQYITGDWLDINTIASLQESNDA